MLFLLRMLSVQDNEQWYPWEMLQCCAEFFSTIFLFMTSFLSKHLLESAWRKFHGEFRFCLLKSCFYYLFGYSLLNEKHDSLLELLPSVFFPLSCSLLIPRLSFLKILYICLLGLFSIALRLISSSKKRCFKIENPQLLSGLGLQGQHMFISLVLLLLPSWSESWWKLPLHQNPFTSRG